jgi:hypothetical protein
MKSTTLVVAEQRFATRHKSGVPAGNGDRCHLARELNELRRRLAMTS